MNAPFIGRYQEPATPTPDQGLAMGTMTKTATREQPDQDPSRWPLLMGTGTHTDSREMSDQDPAALSGTSTRTDTSREQSDDDWGGQQWAIIPRG